MARSTIVIILVTSAILSCSPKVSTTVSNPYPRLASEEKVALLDIAHKLPVGTIKVGDLKYGDSGFTTDCSFNSLMNKARIAARENGANIVKVIDKKTPGFWSTCYRLRIELHKYDGDLSKISQYQIALD